MGTGRPSIAKRQRELKQIEKRQEKEARRAQRKADKKNVSETSIEPGVMSGVDFET
jgi:hypothetical protein